MSTTIKPEVGKYSENGGHDNFDLVAEYVEATIAVPHPLDPPDTFRRDLIARLYVAMVASSVYQHTPYPKVAKEAILLADTLIEAMKEEPC